MFVNNKRLKASDGLADEVLRTRRLASALYHRVTGGDPSDYEATILKISEKTLKSTLKNHGTTTKFNQNYTMCTCDLPGGQSSLEHRLLHARNIAFKHCRAPTQEGEDGACIWGSASAETSTNTVQGTVANWASLFLMVGERSDVGFQDNMTLLLQHARMALHGMHSFTAVSCRPSNHVGHLPPPQPAAVVLPPELLAHQAHQPSPHAHAPAPAAAQAAASAAAATLGPVLPPSSEAMLAAPHAEHHAAAAAAAAPTSNMTGGNHGSTGHSSSVAAASSGPASAPSTAQTSTAGRKRRRGRAGAAAPPPCPSVVDSSSEDDWAPIDAGAQAAHAAQQQHAILAAAVHNAAENAIVNQAGAHWQQSAEVAQQLTDILTMSNQQGAAMIDLLESIREGVHGVIQRLDDA